MMQTESVSIRAATLRDLPSLREIWRKTFASDRQTLEMLELLFFDLSVRSLVVLWQGRCAGALLYRDISKLREVLVLMIETRLRGHGLGTRLLEFCVATGRGAGIEQIRLQTWNGNHRARRFFEGMCFEARPSADVYASGENVVDYYRFL